MAKYEVWNKADLGGRKTQPLSTHFTIDNGIEAAKKASVGTHEKDTFNVDPKDPWGFGTPGKITVPNMAALVERSDCQSVIRGYGINGQWKDAVAHCKRCSNTGTDKDNWNVPCASCKGASAKPKV